jgi:hypothetical protein
VKEGKQGSYSQFVGCKWFKEADRNSIFFFVGGGELGCISFLKFFPIAHMMEVV